MTINPAPLYLAQTVITGLLVALSIAIVGTSAHVLDVFNKQRTTNPWWTPMWPLHFDTSGTKALIASSTVTLVLCGAFMIASFIPRVSWNQNHLHWSIYANDSTGWIEAKIYSPRSALPCHPHSSTPTHGRWCRLFAHCQPRCVRD